MAEFAQLFEQIASSLEEFPECYKGRSIVPIGVFSELNGLKAVSFEVPRAYHKSPDSKQMCFADRGRLSEVVTTSQFSYSNRRFSLSNKRFAFSGNGQDASETIGCFS